MGAKDQVSMFSCKLLRLRIRQLAEAGGQSKNKSTASLVSEAVNSIVRLSTNTTLFSV